MKYPDWLIQKFWSCVDIRGPHDCWPWKLAVSSQGYGRFRHHKEPKLSIQAHVMALEIATGEAAPKGLLGCHSCDTPRCCNPAHIWMGTPAENVADMMRKGRNSYVTRVGESANSAKLKADDIKTIRSLPKSMANIEIGASFGVSHVTISLVRRHKAWKHI